MGGVYIRYIVDFDYLEIQILVQEEIDIILYGIGNLMVCISLIEAI
jgi:hypothetical protein